MMMTDLSVYSSLCFCILTLNWKTYVGGSSNVLEAEKHLELGRQLTAKGQFSDALAHFDAAVENDPNNYLTYFRRATVFLALGKSKAALPDLDKVVKLKPDFTASWIQRGNILLKMGRIDEAHMDFEAVLRREPGNPEANLQYSVIEPLKRDLELGHVYKEDHDYASAIAAFSRAIEACPWNAELREARAECYLQSGQPMQAIFDWRTVTKLRSDSTDIHLRVSLLLYELGEGEDSLLEIRECLKLDPDHKDCFAHYKYIKKLVSLMKAAQDFQTAEQYEDCITKAQGALKLEKRLVSYQFAAKHLLCQCQHKAGNPIEAIKTCTEALEMEENANVLCHRAEAHIANDNFDEALQDYQRAHQVDGNSQCAQEGIRNTQKMKKQASKRDYYKILGVKRTATKREVTKAYRKLAQQWHPDNFDEAEKKMAEKKFIEIAAAKEVLSDPEKRQKFDSGEDPLDPESHSGQGFNPFAQGFQFNQFRSDGPFQFRFNFN